MDRESEPYSYTVAEAASITGAVVKPVLVAAINGDVL